MKVIASPPDLSGLLAMTEDRFFEKKLLDALKNLLKVKKQH